MALFTVYLDESYGPADVYSVGGYVATFEQWIEFAREWKELLVQEGVDYLHKADLEHCRGQFAMWQGLSKQEQAANKLRVNKRACGIIRRRCNAGFAFSVIKSEWEAVDKGKWSTWFGDNFYAAGALNCMRQIAAVWAKQYNRTETMDYIFEKGATGWTEVDRMLRIFDSNEITKDAYKLRGWNFEPKKDQTIKGTLYPGIVQLQAADFLAYEVYRDMEHQIIGDKSRPRRGALQCLTQQPGIPHYLKFLRNPGLQWLVDAANEEFKDIDFNPF